MLFSSLYNLTENTSCSFQEAKQSWVCPNVLFSELNLFSFCVSSLHFQSHELSRIRQNYSQMRPGPSSAVFICLEGAHQGKATARDNYTLSLPLPSRGSLSETSTSMNDEVPRFCSSAPYIFLI